LFFLFVFYFGILTFQRQFNTILVSFKSDKGEYMRVLKWILTIQYIFTFLVAGETTAYLPQHPGTPLGSRPDISPDYFQQGIYYMIDATFNP